MLENSSRKTLPLQNMEAVNVVRPEPPRDTFTPRVASHGVMLSSVTDAEKLRAAIKRALPLYGTTEGRRILEIALEGR